MEEKLTTEELANLFLHCFFDTLFTDKPHEIGVSPWAFGQGYTLFPSLLEMGEYRFETHALDVDVIKNGKKIGKCPNPEMYDWLIGFAVYLKERNLIEDFKQFYEWE